MIKAIITLLPIVIKLVKFAENIFGAKTGEIKKQYVLDIIGKIIKSMIIISSGGQRETWREIDNIYNTQSEEISTMIDDVAGIIFPKKVE